MKRHTVWNILALIVLGVILADLIANPGGTGTLFSGINTFWNNSIGGLLGQTGSGFSAKQTSGSKGASG